MPDFYAYAYFDPRDGVPFYIGKGQGYRARKHLHQATNRGVAERLSALRELGLRPTIETYPCADEAAAFELERRLIARYGRECEGGPLCNILEAGERSGGFLGRKHTPETKEKIRAAMRARKMSDEHKQKIRDKAKLRTFSDLARAKAAEWSRTPEGREQRAKQAREMGAEHLAAITKKARVSNIGRVRSAETRARMSAAQKGRTVSDETRAKMSAAQRKRYARPDA